MRPAPQSFFHQPLSALLSAEAAVRVLRELALHGEELTTTSLAKRTGLTSQSVRNVLGTLGDAGLLRVYGLGRAASFQLDVTHPVARMLAELFRAEDERARTVLERIRETARRLRPLPLAVWMYGSVARGEDRIGSDLDLLLVIGEDERVEHAADEFRQELGDTEAEHRMTISVVPVSGADVLRLARAGDPFWREIVSDGVVLHGESPEILLSRLERAERSRTTDEVENG